MQPAFPKKASAAVLTGADWHGETRPAVAQPWGGLRGGLRGVVQKAVTPTDQARAEGGNPHCGMQTLIANRYPSRHRLQSNNSQNESSGVTLA